MGKLKLLDLFCGAGGASMGYYRAGFEVEGVDIEPQPHYPFKFYQADALTFPLEGYDAYHASPPCQGYSIMLNLPWLRGKVYPKLIPAVRTLFVVTDKPYVIENVTGARYRQSLPEGLQAGYLCGQMFGLPIFRHRYFETNFAWFQPGHPKHEGHIRDGRKLGGRAREIVVRRTGQTYGFDRPECAVGHAAMAGIVARKALGTEWMNRDEASQAIPPAYTEYIGKYLLRALQNTLK
jgi:DNA (cytosine-5)-methyltransferase 1